VSESLQRDIVEVFPFSSRPPRAADLEQPTPGIFWWRTPTGAQYRVGPSGTIRIGRNPQSHAFEQALWASDRAIGPPVQGVG